MQITCPWCSNLLALDPAKIPAQPFLIRCPKCQGSLQLQGRGSSDTSVSKHGPPPAALSTAGTQSPAAASPAPPAAIARDSVRGESPAPATGNADRALIALEDGGIAKAIAATLRQKGYAVDDLSNWQEKVRFLHQGDYDVVVTAKGGPVLQEGTTIYKRMNHLSPEARRRTFLVLVGEEFKTGDGTEAFVATADLVVHSSHTGHLASLLDSRMDERSRVYRAYRDVERWRRRERAASP